jgi:hypothetical protein
MITSLHFCTGITTECIRIRNETEAQSTPEQTQQHQVQISNHDITMHNSDNAMTKTELLAPS